MRAKRPEISEKLKNEPPDPEAFGRFAGAMKKLLRVPRVELSEKLAQDIRRKPSRARSKARPHGRR